jgi:hypothetical protein
MDKGRKSPAATQAQEEKAARLREALRDNLKKRKAQAKARKSNEPGKGQESSDG